MLSHASLSKEPIRIDMGNFEYSQFEQKCEYNGNGSMPSAYPTYNATQTYGSNGQPTDSDND